MMSLLRRQLINLNGILHHAGNYVAERNIYGNYAVSISPELICCYDVGSDSIRQLSEVEEWRRILAL